MCFDQCFRIGGIGARKLGPMALRIVDAIIRRQARYGVVRSPALRSSDRDDRAFRYLRDPIDTPDPPVMRTAIAIGPAQWLLAEEAEPSLRELGIRGDIIRTMQRALSAKGQDRSPSDFAIFDATMASEQTIIGRVIEKGLHDELKGSAYLDFRPEVARSGAVDETRALLIGRLQKLERMGLARASTPSSVRWRRRVASSRVQRSAPTSPASLRHTLMLALRTELDRHQFGGSLAHAVTDVVAMDEESVAAIVSAAHDHCPIPAPHSAV
jgi:Protein of unknown function (DUF3363)